MGNRDGFREWDLAGHEAAHAVVALLSGWAVGRISIAPSQREADGGMCDAAPPDLSCGWPVPLSPTAAADVFAAGMAWDALVPGNRRDAWWCSRSDRAIVRECYGVNRCQFLAGVARCVALFQRPEVRAVVGEAADRLVVGRSGEIWGSTVEQAMAKRGLFPDLRVAA